MAADAAMVGAIPNAIKAGKKYFYSKSTFVNDTQMMVSVEVGPRLPLGNQVSEWARWVVPFYGTTVDALFPPDFKFKLEPGQEKELKLCKTLAFRLQCKFSALDDEEKEIVKEQNLQTSTSKENVVNDKFLLSKCLNA